MLRLRGKVLASMVAKMALSGRANRPTESGGRSMTYGWLLTQRGRQFPGQLPRKSETNRASRRLQGARSISRADTRGVALILVSSVSIKMK